jgi:hypothetical protein
VDGVSGQDVADELAKVVALSERLAFQILAQRGRQAESELRRIPWPCHSAIVDKADALHNAPLKAQFVTAAGGAYL